MKSLITMIALMMTVSLSFAQVNIKDKLNRKADEAIDNLLFGKKKKNDKDASSNDDSADAFPSRDDESGSSTSDDDPTGGYVRKPVDYTSINAGDVVHFRTLIDFLPDQVNSFSLASKPEGSTARYGDASYSFGAKGYSDGDRKLKISIFDYLLTYDLWGAYANSYEYENTEGLMKSIQVDGNPGWYSTNYSSGESSVMLFVNHRFFLTVQEDGASEGDLTSYVRQLDLDKLPQGTPPEESAEEETSQD